MSGRYLALMLIASIPATGCFNPDRAPEEDDTSGGTTSAARDSSTGSVDPTADPSADASTGGDPSATTADASTSGVDTGATDSGGAVCGDGMIEGDEACDDANEVDGDGCTACGVDPGYMCAGEPSVCGSAACGDGILGGPETCDDGNREGDDGCAADCTVELYSRCVGAGPGSCAPIRIVYAPAEPDDPAFRDAMAAITAGTVDYFDTGAGTPTLVGLEANYDCVIVHPDNTFFDPMQLGTTLASFVDGGGNVVLGIAVGFPMVGLVGSPIMSPAYSPITSVEVEFLKAPMSDAGDGTTVIHAGVAGYQAVIVDNGVALQGMGAVDSTFTNGYIATAYRPDFKVVYINGTGNAVVMGTGDWPRLFANACAAGYVQ